jgi:hypothetical protein
MSATTYKILLEGDKCCEGPEAGVTGPTAKSYARRGKLVNDTYPSEAG